MSANCEVWVHDTRVEGVVLDAPGRRVLRVDRSTPVMSIATSVQAVVQRAGGATALWLVFHAPYTGQSRSQAEGGWEDALFGGMSELGKDGVTSRNVAEFGASLRGLFSDSIRVLACGGAARWNGMEICRRLAFHSQTLVIASQDAQEYSVNHLAGGAIDVGPWEGRVFKFLPSGEAAAWFVGGTASGSEPPLRSVSPVYTGQ
jgi:hypothetical protein